MGQGSAKRVERAEGKGKGLTGGEGQGQGRDGWRREALPKQKFTTTPLLLWEVNVEDRTFYIS